MQKEADKMEAQFLKEIKEIKHFNMKEIET